MAIAARFDPQTDPHSRRGAKRRTLRLSAERILPSGDFATVQVHNISSTGLLIESKEELAASETLDISLPHAGDVPAKIIWQSGDFYGCAFTTPISNASLSAAQLQSEAPPADASSSGDQLETFGFRLQRMRKQRSLTQSDIASHLGVSKPTVWAWEHDRAKPASSRIEGLAEILQVSAQELMQSSDTGSLKELLSRSKQRIADAVGIAPSKIRIMIEY